MSRVEGQIFNTSAQVGDMITKSSVVLLIWHGFADFVFRTLKTRLFNKGRRDFNSRLGAAAISEAALQLAATTAAISDVNVVD
jgi:hypothetical protein